ncbi:hypothetical protein ACQJBY_038476 [Aegilops geniculata]
MDQKHFFYLVMISAQPFPEHALYVMHTLYSNIYLLLCSARAQCFLEVSLAENTRNSMLVLLTKNSVHDSGPILTQMITIEVTKLSNSRIRRVFSVFFPPIFFHINMTFIVYS